MEMADDGMIHIPGGTEWDVMRFHHVTQSGVQFVVYELFCCCFLEFST